MKFWRDPPRLSELDAETRPELVEALKALRRLNGTAAEVQIGAERLAAKLASGGLPAATAGAVGVSGTCLWLVGGVIAALAGFTYWRVSAPRTMPQHTPAAIVSNAKSSIEIDQASAEATPRTVPMFDAQPVTAKAAPTAAAAQSARARLLQPSRTVRPPSAPELALLAGSQDALAHDPALALRLAEQHAREYPKGVLTEEREVLAIEALFKLHRAHELIARADRFVRSFPRSPHRLRMQALLAMLREQHSADGSAAEP